MSSNELDRYIGRNGQKPTQKDKWKAFWRLWRICKRASDKSNPFMSIAAETSFGWLLDDEWDWVRLASSPSDRLSLPLNNVPIVIRKLWLKHDKKKRKREQEAKIAKRYGIILDYQRDKLVASAVRENGIEITPDQVSKIRSQVCEKIRNKLIDIGWNENDIPISDEGIILLLRKTKGFIE